MCKSLQFQQLLEGCRGRLESDPVARVAAGQLVAVESPSRDVPRIDKPAAVAPGVPDGSSGEGGGRLQLSAAVCVTGPHAVLSGEFFLEDLQLVAHKQFQVRLILGEQQCLDLL